MNIRLVALLLFLSVSPAFAQQQKDNLWVTDGEVSAVAAHDNRLYIGGFFSRIGPPTGGLVQLDGTSGVLTQSLGVDGAVFAIVPDGAGGHYVGGSFTHIQGLPRANVARIDANGNVAPWNPGVHGVVRAMVRAGGTVYLGGSFDQVGASARTNLAAVDTSGTVQAWNPNASSFVFALAEQNGLIYVGGQFNTIAGEFRNRIAALDPVTGAATPWNPICIGTVEALATRYDPNTLEVTVYVGGAFSFVGGQSRSNLAVLDATVGSPTYGQATSFDPAPDANVSALRLTADPVPALFVGGGFTTIAGQPRNHLASFNGTTLTAWNPDADAAVSAIELDGSTLYASGNFTHLAGQPRHYAGAVNATGIAASTPWNPAPGAPANALAVQGTKVWMGGTFTFTGGVERQNLAALDLTTGQPTAWNPSPNSIVFALEWVRNHLYVGGEFTSFASGPHSSVARFDAAGVLDAWEPAVNGGVYAFEQRPLDATTDLLYMGGAFFASGISPRTKLAAFAIGAVPVLTDWNPFVDGTVFSLGVDATHVWVGGNFSQLGTQPTTNLGRVDFAGNATGWSTNIPPRVTSIAVADTSIYVGLLDFSVPPGTTVPGVRQLRKANAAFMNSVTCAGYVAALNYGAAGLDVAGNFTQLGGLPRTGLGRVDPASLATTSWDPQVSVFSYGLNQPGHATYVSALAELGGVLYAGGRFDAVLGKPRSNVAGIFQSTTAVEPPAAPAARLALRAAPNPARTSQVLWFDLGASARGRVAIHDVAGRVVRVLAEGMLAAGPHRIEWDGRTSAGARVAPGLYFARVEAGAKSAVTKLLRVGP
jgi:hypothetical protein